MTVWTSAGTLFPNGDALAAGSDQITGNGGNDILFGDHGIVGQMAGTFAVLTTGNVIRIETANESDGGANVPRGDDGNDRVLGGNGGDDIQGGAGEDVVFGDQGLILYTSAGVPTLDQLRNTNDAQRTLSTATPAPTSSLGVWLATPSMARLARTWRSATRVAYTSWAAWSRAWRRRIRSSAATI